MRVRSPRLRSATLTNHQAMELILTGESLTALDIERYGIANKAVPVEQDVIEQAIKIATRIATFSAPTVGLAKQAIKAGEQDLQYIIGTYTEHS